MFRHRKDIRTPRWQRQASAKDHGLQEHGQGKEEHFKNFNFLNFEEHFNFQHVLQMAPSTPRTSSRSQGHKEHFDITKFKALRAVRI